MRSLCVVVGLIATLVSQNAAQLPFGPVFPVSQYDTIEGGGAGQQAICLSAPILTRPQTPPFNGSIEVDIIAEDLPSQDPRPNAQFGTDYLANTQNTSSRIFTVVFLSQQANSTEHVILLSDDPIFEEREYFRLRIIGIRFNGQASHIFRPQDGLTNTFVDVNIEDNDFVLIKWTISDAIKVTEGEGVEVTLSGEANGIYANPIAIGVVCAETIATDVEPAFPGRDFNFTAGTKLHFADVETLRSFSSDQVIVPIINDDIAEPCESFICTLQGGTVDAVRSIEPNRVTIEICDDDQLIVHWATDFYQFSESQIEATVQLVTDSKFEAIQVSVQGFPRQIPNGHTNRFPSLVVPGPSIPGFALAANIEQAGSLKFGPRVFGNAQVTQSGRTDVVNTINDFVFTPANKSAFENFTIIDDDVLEFDELLIAEFNFGREISRTWNVIKGVPSTAFILIRDDDAVEVNFNEDSYTVVENEGQVNVSLRIDGKFFVPVWAVVEITDGTATDPEDYFSAVRYNVTFRQTAFTDGDEPASTALSSPIVINIQDDGVVEGLEYFQARIVETSDRFRVRISQDTVNVTIIDNDNVTIRYEEERYSVEEEVGFITLALVLEGDALIPVSVTVSTLDLLDSSLGDAATAEDDYSPRDHYEITFPPGSRRQLYNVTIEDDIIPENSEFFNADVNTRPENSSFVVIGSPKQPLIEILDLIDENVEIVFEQTAYIIFENQQVVTVTLTLSDAYREDIVVDVTVDEVQGIPGLLRAQVGVDFSTAGFPRQVTIPAGQTSVQFNITVMDELLVERDEQFQVSFSYSGGQPGVTVAPDYDKANITVRNDDALMVMFDTDSYSVGEEDGSLFYRLNATGAASFDYEVVITAEDGPTICGLDYHEAIDVGSGTDSPLMSCSYSLTLTIPAGDNASIGVVAIINDTIYEGEEDFFLHLSIPTAFQVLGINEGSPLKATVTIKDDDELRVFFDPAAYFVPEGENQVLVLRADKTFEVPFTIDVTLMDITAVALGDYEDRSYQVEFNVTTQSGTLVVHAETDNILENDDDFKAVLSVPAGLPRVFAGTPSEATVTILDRTAAEVYFDPDVYNVMEGQTANLILRLTKDVDPSITITVMVQTMNGSAIDGIDYTGGLLTATFSGSSTTSVPVPTLSDNVLEGEETFTGVIQVPPETTNDYRVTLGSPDTATVNITDATIAGVYFDPDVYMVNEGNNVTLTLRTNVTANKRFGVLVNTVDDTAISPDDYQGVEKLAIFEIGSSTATVVYTTVTDGIREGLESFFADLTVPPAMMAMGIFPGMPSRATVNIIDDDELVCMLVRTMHEVREDMGPLVMTVMCSTPSEDPFTLIVHTSDGTAVEGAQEDYIGREFPVFFPTGVTIANTSIPIVDDIVFEPDEDFFLTLEIPQPAQDIGVMRSDPHMATVIILNDEIPVSIDIERRVVDVIENQEFVEVCLVKSGQSSRPIMAIVNVNEIMDDGSSESIRATSEEDFEPDPATSAVVLSANETKACVNVTIIDDETVEREEPFEITILFPPGQPAIDSGEIVPSALQINGTINIIDDDETTVQFEQDMYMVRESDGMVDVRVVASGRTSFEYTFTVTPMDLTARNNFDYTFSPTPYTFGPTDDNEPIPSLVISIPIIPDELNEFDENFNLTIEVSAEDREANVSEGEISMTVVLIKDDDVVTVTFGPQNYTVTEGDPAEVMIVLDKPAVKDITVTVTTMDITATSPGDYFGGSFDVSIPAGSIKVTLPVSTLRDNIVEADEYFKATLSLPGAPEGGVVGTPDVAYITIQDDTPMIPVRFNPANYSMKEGVDGNAVIFLEVQGDHPDFDFTVTVTTQDGTAIDGSDYEGGSFTVTFPAGVNVASFNVTILNDATAECAKLFTLDLEIPAAATAMGVMRGSPDTATVHIMDDDVEELLLSFETADYLVKENVGSFVAAVEASGAADFPYTVTVVTADDTAIGGDDFVSQQFQLDFPAGQTRVEFTVDITDDDQIETMESFQLLLSLPEDLISKGVQVGPNSAATITIMDNDVQVKFSQPLVATTEEEGQALITVVAMGDLSSDFSIIVMAINGSAVESSDFTGSTWQVDFASGITQAGFIIPIMQDNVTEDTEEFLLKIVIMAPADQRIAVGEPSQQRVIIRAPITDLDNDTVRGDPLFSIPLPSKYIADTELKSIQLCFEIHGVSGHHYNLISDACTSVSAEYSAGVLDKTLNVITEMGVKTQGNSGTCHTIKVDLDRCSAFMDDSYINKTSTVTVDGITMTTRRQRVRVSVPNCDRNKRLTMWIICTKRNNEDMLELVVARGDGLEPTAHGLIGQFWNIPLEITPYVGPYGDGTVDISDKVYSVTVSYPGAPKRTFIADYGKQDWLDNRPCLYAGNQNGGPIAEVRGSGSVIEGRYWDYEVDGLFHTDFRFSKYNDMC